MLHLPAPEGKCNCSKKETWRIPGAAPHPLCCPRVLGRCLERRSLPLCAWVGAPDGHLAVCYQPPRACCKKSLPCNISCTHLEAVKPGQTWFSSPAQPQLPWLNTGTTRGAPAGSGAQHPSAIPDRKMQWEKPNRARWPLISTEQTCPTGEAQRGSSLPEGNCWFSLSEGRVTVQGKAPGNGSTATKTQLQTLPKTPQPTKSVSPNLTSRV